MTAELDKIFEAKQAEHARPVGAQRRDRVPPPRVWLDIHDVEDRYRKGRSTVARWLADPSLAFPRPRYVRGKRIWHIEELDAFDQRLLEQQSQQSPSAASRRPTSSARKTGSGGGTTTASNHQRRRSENGIP